MKRRWLHAMLWALIVAGLGLLPAPPQPARAAVPASSDASLRTVDAAITAWDLDEARAALDRAPPGALKDLRTAIIAVYEGDYAIAEQTLAAALASGALEKGSREEEQARLFLGLARGSQRALGPAIEVRSRDGNVIAVFADAKDAVIAPYLFDAMAEARMRIDHALGLSPTHPVRFEFLDDPAKLAMVTPLSLDNIRTTNTVGITKYRRIMMVTPRMMVYGYGWIDTAVHEYVHYVLTMRTANKAPVWLQEGLAKLLETRWRLPTTPPLEPSIAFLLHRAITRDELVTLDEMYPSVAMLPSQEKAALAYAEVQTMLQLLFERGGREALGDLLDRVAAGEDARDALAAAWGADFDTFFAQWKRTTRARTAGRRKGPLRGMEFRDPDAPQEDVDASLFGDVFSHLGGGKARQHARLGVLLTLRGHFEAAAMQYEKARKADRAVRNDPKLARRLGELYVRLEKYDRAVPLLEIAARDDPEHANVAAAEGRARLRSGDREGARAALSRAVRNNPFIPTLHCDLAALAEDAARRRHEQAQCRE